MTQQRRPARGTLIGQGRTAEVYVWGDDRVLKLYHTEWQASWAEREAHITAQIAAAGLPAPAVEGVIEVDGRHGILFERIAGPSLLRQFEAKPWTLTRSLRAFTDLHLAMHARVIPDLPSRREQLVRQIQDAPGVPDRIRVAALTQLQRLPEGNAVCHGDYHPDNVLMTRRGPIIIDWG
ncbi:MAG TPA: aminoglycoside phosphotransferase family protein, partial [Ktedonobacterales bacterium]